MILVRCGVVSRSVSTSDLGSGNEGAVVSFLVFVVFAIVLDLDHYVGLVKGSLPPMGEFYFYGFVVTLISTLLLIALGAKVDYVGLRRGSLALRQAGLAYMAIGLALIGVYTTVNFGLKFYSRSLDSITRTAGLVIIPLGYTAWIHFIVAYSHRILREHRELALHASST